RAGLYVECSDISGRAGQRFRDGAPHDEQVLKDDARRAGAHRQPLDRAAESGTEIHPTADAEALDGAAGALIERVETIPVVEDHPVAGDYHAAVPYARRGRDAVVRIEAPELLAGRGVEREDAELRRGAIEH